MQAALKKVNGVVSAEVNHDSGEAKVNYDSGKTNSGALIKTVQAVQGMSEFNASVKSES